MADSRVNSLQEESCILVNGVCLWLAFPIAFRSVVGQKRHGRNVQWGKSCLPHGCQEAEVKEEWAVSNLFPPTDPHLLRATEVCIDGRYLQFLSSSDSIWKHSRLSYFTHMIHLMTLIHLTFKSFFKKCHLVLKLLCICTISFKIVWFMKLPSQNQFECSIQQKQ